MGTRCTANAHGLPPAHVLLQNEPCLPSNAAEHGQFGLAHLAWMDGSGLSGSVWVLLQPCPLRQPLEQYSPFMPFQDEAQLHAGLAQGEYHADAATVAMLTCDFWPGAKCTFRVHGVPERQAEQQCSPGKPFQDDAH
mmetsp:Transcript_53370/g.124982  ORF Transcript_53370/g.124982 Transcript_53370/m.124982 type:complete len:137 (+) Transcript_53370:852-1262(+)